MPAHYYAMPIHMLAPDAPPFIPFSNLSSRADLISLEAARRDPAIVYGSFDRLSSPTGSLTTSPTAVSGRARKGSSASMASNASASEDSDDSAGVASPGPEPGRHLVKVRSCSRVRRVEAD